MICRPWRGWATPQNADADQRIGPAEAQAVLADFDKRAAHYQVLDRRDQPG